MKGKNRTYAVKSIPVHDHEFEVPRDEKWRFVGLESHDDDSSWLVFIVQKIDPDYATSGIVWGCG